MSFQDRSVLITGASQGIGRSIALMFARETNRPIILLARNEDNLKETEELCRDAGGGPVLVLPCDATDPDALSNLKLPSGFAPASVLINNAGHFLYKPLAETTDKEFSDQIDLNLFTAVHTTNRFLPDLKNADRALIINICSVGAMRGLGDSGAYSAAKHALLGYTRSLREELQETDIGVTAINLGQTESPSWDGSDIDRNRLIDPDDLARLLVALTHLSPRTLVEEMTIQPTQGRVPPM